VLAGIGPVIPDEPTYTTWFRARNAHSVDACVRGGLSYPPSSRSGTTRRLAGTWEGRRLRIDYASTGEDATYEGPTPTEISVDADDRPADRLPEEPALRIVTDPRLQD
jgi:hypothetical protein